MSDHYFGSLKGVRGFNDRNTQPMASGLPNSFYQPVDQEDLSQYMLPFHVDAHSTSAMCMVSNVIITTTQHNNNHMYVSPLFIYLFIYSS